jgi:hypothetical protein
MSSRKEFCCRLGAADGIAKLWRCHEGAGAGFGGSGQRTFIVRNSLDSSDTTRRRRCGHGVGARSCAVAGLPVRVVLPLLHSDTGREVVEAPTR